MAIQYSPAVCLACGHAAMYALDRACFLTLVALAAGGHSPVNRCHRCRTGEMVDARTPRERERAYATEVADALTRHLVKLEILPAFPEEPGAPPAVTVEAVECARSVGFRVRLDLDGYRDGAFGIDMDVHFLERAGVDALRFAVADLARDIEEGHPHAWSPTWWPPKAWREHRDGADRLVDRQGRQWIVLTVDGADHPEDARAMIVLDDPNADAAPAEIRYAHAMSDAYRPVGMRPRR